MGRWHNDTPYREVDRVLIRALYHAAVRPGATRAEIELLLR